MIIRRFARAMDLLAWAITRICSLLMIWLIIITGWQVFGRYVLNHTPAWVERGALLTIVYISLPMAAVGIHQGFHMSVALFVQRLDRRLAAAVAALVDIVLALFGLAMAWFGGVIALRVWGSKMSVLPFPRGCLPAARHLRHIDPPSRSSAWRSRSSPRTASHDPID